MWYTFLVLLAFNYVKGETRLDPLVDTTQGIIKGLRTEDGYSMFLGIPYGLVDGDNPFGIAQPYPNFDSVYEAYDDPAACPQIENKVAIGSLDCLRLNVFVPNKASFKNKLAVMIWLHGGGFTVGYNTQNYYGPKNLVKHDVIIVSVNYRLGPYGFMCLDTPQVPGNQGIKDQLIALRWVKNNIASFGGDVDKITLMGESAGSVSAETHLFSNNEKLFNRIILQSGTVFKPAGLIESDSSVPLEIAEQLGVKTDDVSEALAFLARADPKLVIAAATELSITFRGCIEREIENVDSLLTKHPYNLDVPKVNGMEILAGYNNREGLLMNAYKSSNYINSNYFHETLGRKFEYDEEFKQMEDIVRHFYLSDAELNEGVRNTIIDFESDFFYNYPIQWSLEKYLKNGAKKIYQYMFSYDGNLNFIKNDLGINLEGAAHGDELGYLFVMSNNKTSSAEDERVIDRITTLWTNFAKYGDPTPDETELLPVSWTPITEDTIPYLNIDSEVSMKTRPFNDRLAFWNLFFKANQHRLKDLIQK